MVKQFWRFVSIGIFNTLSQYLLFWLFGLVIPAFLAYSSSYFITVIGSYLLNSRYTYAQAYSWQHFWRFAVIVLGCQFGLSNLIYIGLEVIIGSLPTLVFGITTLVMIPISFSCTRVVFIKSKGK
ncbi:MAG: GtrA family protein [Culicoidibacterales bacterium]